MCDTGSTDHRPHEGVASTAWSTQLLHPRSGVGAVEAAFSGAYADVGSRPTGGSGLPGAFGGPRLMPGIQRVAQALQLLCGCSVSDDPGNCAVEVGGSGVCGLVVQSRDDADQPVDDA